MGVDTDQMLARFRALHDEGATTWVRQDVEILFDAIAERDARIAQLIDALHVAVTERNATIARLTLERDHWRNFAAVHATREQWQALSPWTPPVVRQHGNLDSGAAVIFGEDQP